MSLPAIHPDTQLDPAYQAFIEQLKNTRFCGDIDESYGGRLIASTDNSIYQQLPQAVLYPRTQEDVGVIMALAAQAEHQQIRFSPRGGGTGTNGQALTQWLVIDLSRHLTGILEINPQEGWVRVETGIVKDALNAELAKHGFFFAPDTSTSNRCTIGGMINTDASGQGSLVYGKTSDHVLALTTYTMLGNCLKTQPVPLDKARKLATLATPEGALYQQVIKSCVDLRGTIVERFPKLNRFLTGYDLLHAYDPAQQAVDVSRLITGSEGTLGIVTEAKLNITRIPQHKVLVNVKYSDFQAALRHAPRLVQAQATSVETIDSKVLNLARQDIVWHGVQDLLEKAGDAAMDGINMVEFTARSAVGLQQKLSNLEALLAEDQAAPNKGVIGYQICEDGPSIQRIYQMRKKAVGLLGATQGKRKPIAFAEDTAVPPQHLADFIEEFRDLLDSHGLAYGMFGHVDAGVLHVRPALDMQDAADEKKVRQISDAVVKLTAKYGGLMWGEHGKGYRSEYGPEFFGPQLYTELRKIKAAFDPLNRLNPGKICVPLGIDEPLVSVDAKKRGWFDKQIPTAMQTQFQSAMDCNGNGLCFNYDARTPMCPSYRVTQDRRYSPKGRATLLREWLRLASQDDYDTSQGAPKSSIWRRLRQSRSASNKNDFSHQVKRSMDECLACKACTSQCPVSVDIPTHRAKFLAHYHSRYRRPIKDYLVKNIERWLPRMSHYGRLVNRFNDSRLGRYVATHWIGYQDMPALSVPALAKRDAYQQALTWEQFKAMREGAPLQAEERRHFVALVQDPFTSFFEARLVEDFLRLAARLGAQPVILPYLPNGKAAHVKGFLEHFETHARAQAALLNEVHAYQLPMVGLDASTTLCFADEYTDILGHERGEFKVKLVQQWLLEDVDPASFDDFIKVTPERADDRTPVQLLLHCTEQTAVPESAKLWQQLFAYIEVPCEYQATGCCGMAGTYGHESENLQKSAALYRMSWQKPVEESRFPLATGFSCRCQSKRFSDRKPRHPLQHLLKIMT